MTNVACFCGCVYSFSGAVGACPNCGEYTTFTSVGVEEERQMRRELDAVLRPHAELAGSPLSGPAAAPSSRGRSRA